MAALAVGDEQPLLARMHITQSQPEHLAASQPAQQHRLHHRPVPMGAQRPYQGVGLLWVDHPRQRARGADQRYPSHRAAGTTGRQSLRHGVSRNDTADDQVLEQPGDRGQPPLDRARRQTRLTILDPHHLRPTSRLPLGGDERQHVGTGDLLGHLGHLREKHLQIERRGQHRIRPRPGSDHLQVVVEQPMPQPRDTATTDRANQARHKHHNLPTTASAPGPAGSRKHAEDHPHIQTSRPFPSSRIPRRRWSATGRSGMGCRGRRLRS